MNSDGKLRIAAPPPGPRDDGSSGPVRAAGLVLALLCLCWASSTRASDRSDAGAVRLRSAEQFVQEFYDWYSTEILSDTSSAPWKRVRAERRSSFSPQLVRDLDEDAAAQARARGVTVGIDFDPFVASQDPEDRYQVGKVIQNGRAYFVNVHGIRQGKRIAEPAVVAELESTGGRWRFRNFRYPHDRDLLAVLTALREARQRKK